MFSKLSFTVDAMISVTDIIWRRMLEGLVNNESVKTHKKITVADAVVL
jgi:hypothetical protein